MSGQSVIGLFAASAMAALAVRAETPFLRPPIQAAATQSATAGRGGAGGDSAAPARKTGEGAGPFRKMVIRGVTLIDGTGGPPLSPMDIVIEGHRITAVRQAGWPGLAPQANREPRDAEHEIDGTGLFAMPGFVDVHVHGAGKDKAPDLSYSYKLWLAHGVTTVRGVPLSSAALSSSEKNRSAKNEIVAPRIFNYQTLGSGWTDGPVRTPEQAREWVRWAAAHNIDGIKFFNRGDETPEIDTAAIDEAHQNAMGTVAHLSQNNVAMFNARLAGDAHLDTVTHYYGHFESLLKDKTIQEYPSGYDYNNEQDRFGDIARIWNQIHEPGGKEWVEYLEHQKANHVTFDPTFNIYAASRDLMRARNADWHQSYTMPQLWNYFQSTRDNHGSYFYDWTTENEVAWKNFYQRYMRLINDYKNLGGRVTVRLHLEDLRLRLHRGARADARSRLPAARDHPLGDDVGRADAVRAEGRGGADGRGPRRDARRPGDRRRESAEQPQGALRHRPPAPESADQPPGKGRRREVHDQGRHRLRCAEAAGRRRRRGRRRKTHGADDHRAAMNRRVAGSALVALALAGPAVLAQRAPAVVPAGKAAIAIKPWPEDEVLLARRTEAENRALFQEGPALDFTLTAEFSQINGERTPNNAKQFPGVLTVDGADIPVKLGSRGHLRLRTQTCDFVPIKLAFTPAELAGTRFEGQTTLKLGTHCRNDREYDQYVMREYLAYKLANLVTPLSFRARLARGTYVDARTRRKLSTHSALFLEHENDVARRLGGRDLKLPHMGFSEFEPEALTTAMMLEYMLGNTDFSLWTLHNFVVVQDKRRKFFPVPYDFDSSGMVNPPYAAPDPRLYLRSLTDRLYRGPCRTLDAFDRAAAPFRAHRAEMIAAIDAAGELEPGHKREMKDFLDGFFRRIATPDTIKKTFVDGCPASRGRI